MEIKEAQKKAKELGHCLCNVKLKCPCHAYEKLGICKCSEMSKEENHGFIPQEISDKDWEYVAGDETKKTWDLPENETQHSVYMDTMACVTFASMNAYETLMNATLETNPHKDWLIEKGYVVNGKLNFSDRFIAVLSGTTRQGNTGQKVLQTIRENGLIPESMHPYPRTQRTPVFDWDDYYNPELITQEMKDLGQEFLSRFETQYFYTWQPEVAVNSSPVIVFGATNCTGKTTCDLTYANHAMLYYTNELKDGFMPLYDSYLNDGNFIRLMPPNYKFPYASFSINVIYKTMDFIKEEGKPDVYIVGKDGKYYAILSENVMPIFGGWSNVKVKSVPELDKTKIAEFKLGGVVV